MSKPVKWVSCRYCGAKLRRDFVGQYCPTDNCQWRHGLPKEDDIPRNVIRQHCKLRK
jgi:hypothetical protein